jgi:tripeptide aminopeptidase
MSDLHPFINRQRLLERFLRYVRVDTTAKPGADSYPSSAGQLELGRILVQELKAMGAEDPHQDEHGLVWATVPANIEGPVPTILLNSHVDTSPEAPGNNVNPQVIESYQGGDIALPAEGRVIRVEDCPELAGMVGQCLITTDGRTLLGGDDKAGVAAIMELAHHLIENPHLPHGTVRILFTCDEEIGLGAKHFDIAKAGAAAGYTLDGAGHGEVENENFSADQLEVQAVGYNIHPAIAKDKMINAVRAISNLVVRLPRDRQSPETTEDKQGFLHPYSIEGGVGQASCQILLRDFETERLDEYADLVQELMRELEQSFPGLQMTMKRTRQYRNMADALAKAPQVVEFAEKAFEQLDRKCELGSIRGGTDGAMFSVMGLPTPNLSVGQHNIHSVLEFASLDEMQWAIEHLIELLKVWQEHGRS